MAGHTFTRIGGDGGLLEKPVESDMLVLAPGERADVLVVPHGSAGRTIPVRWVPFDRGYGTTFNRPEEEAFRVQIADAPAAETPPAPDTSRAIAPLDLAGATNVSLELTQADVNGTLVMGVNGVPSWEAEPLMATVGETQVLAVKNTMDFAHPFHLHGFFFQPLDENLAPVHPMEWKDTINVPVDGTIALRRPLRRSPRHVDVPLPHPRSRRRRDDGHDRSPACDPLRNALRIFHA